MIAQPLVLCAMALQSDHETYLLVGGVLALLVVATVLGQVLRIRVQGEKGAKTIQNMNARTNAWWVMVGVFGLAMLCGMVGTVILFSLISLVGLREFLALTPTKAGDRGTLLWVFCLFAPLQYWLVATGWYGLFAVMIPVYAFLFVPLRSALSGDCEGFLERTAKIQWGLMLCVYCVSHAPGLLFLSIPGYEGQNAKLLFYFVLVVQISDVMQYVWGKTLGRHKIAPKVSPNKTWEGFVGGIATATLIGTGLWWVTPFTPLQAAGISLASALMGFAGGLVMSAIKRDQGVKDYGTLIGGHGGVMDRVDSICFAAPVFFHLTRYFFT
jgi:phosphatidate cytidylyltransferase